MQVSSFLIHFTRKYFGDEILPGAAYFESKNVKSAKISVRDIHLSIRWAIQDMCVIYKMSGDKSKMTDMSYYHNCEEWPCDDGSELSEVGVEEFLVSDNIVFKELEKYLELSRCNFNSKHKFGHTTLVDITHGVNCNIKNS